jgi:SAM-dependent methyltransferase
VARSAAWQDAVVVTVDPRAATGFASAVDAYERGRPSYPPVAIANLAREFGLTPASTVLDLAAGTGNLTRALVPLAGHVIGVEPSEAMRAELRAQVPTVDARAGTAEAIPAADGSVDAVFVGEAFHWFRTAEASREIARVLSPAGGLALLWNRAHWSEEELPWLTAFGELLQPYRQAAGPFPAEAEPWKSVLQATGAFAPLSSAEVDHVQTSSPDDVVALVASWSWIANLPDGERAEVLRRVGELVGPQRRLRLRYRTEIHWTRRVGALPGPD